jgi:hypothetical protein
MRTGAHTGTGQRFTARIAGRAIKGRVSTVVVRHRTDSGSDRSAPRTMREVPSAGRLACATVQGACDPGREAPALAIHPIDAKVCRGRSRFQTGVTMEIYTGGARCQYLRRPALPRRSARRLAAALCYAHTAVVARAAAEAQRCRLASIRRQRPPQGARTWHAGQSRAVRAPALAARPCSQRGDELDGRNHAAAQYGQAAAYAVRSKS